MRSFVVLALLLAGCALPPYEPLVCDPQRAGDDAFGYFRFGGWAPRPELLLIDGDCQYWALRLDEVHGRHSEARTGTLTPAEVDAINAELLTGPWSSVDGLHVRMARPVSDAGSTDLWRDDLAVECDGDCRDDRTVRALHEAANGWLERLYARGAPVTGPLTLAGQRTDIQDGRGIPWTGATPLAPLFTAETTELGELDYVRIEAPDDVALLRSIRATVPSYELMTLVDDGVWLWIVRAEDQLPRRATPPRLR